MISLDVHAVDGVRHDDSGWVYNGSIAVGKIDLDPDASDRSILRAFRSAGYLSRASAGKVRLERTGGDPESIEVCDRGTGEPLFAVWIDL